MSRALLDFNPEAHGAIGEQLLFGKPSPPAERPRAIDELEELELADTFLEAQGRDALARLVDGLVRRAAHASRLPLSPTTAAALISRLVREAQIVRAALPGAGALGCMACTGLTSTQAMSRRVRSTRSDFSDMSASV
jgi:hypothetical protein